MAAIENTPAGMLHKDQKNGYALEIPDGWSRASGNFGTLSHHSILFGFIGDKIHYESGDRLSRLTISTGKNIWPGTAFRRAAMYDFLVLHMFLGLKETDITEVVGFRLGNEPNTLYFRYESPYGTGHCISTVREGREYTLRTSVEKGEGEAVRTTEIDRIIRSFHFLPFF